MRASATDGLPGAQGTPEREAPQSVGRGRPRSPGKLHAGPATGLGGLERYAGYGLAMALAVVAGGWAGLALDEWLGTAPLLAILGGLSAAGAATYTIYMRLIVEPARKAEEDQAP